MIFWWEYDVKSVESHHNYHRFYNMNNFITSYDNIIVHYYYKSWNNNNFNFFKWIGFLNKIQLFIFFNVKADPWVPYEFIGYYVFP
jgi:hypothetical protein